jgi:hypothetical protein
MAIEFPELRSILSTDQRAAAAKLLKIAGELVNEAFEKLLNERHLYQSLNIDRNRLYKEHNGGRIGRILDQFLTQKFEKQPWLPLQKAQNSEPVNGFTFRFPNVWNFCSQCDARTPFNLNLDQERPFTTQFSAPPRKATFQVLCLPLQCQGCKSDPILFMVTRKGLKLTLTGRSEFEEVKAPEYIPKAQRKYYSQARIAFNSGQILPALFMLRTLIEQFMRSVINDDAIRGDELCKKYNETLPEDFKRRFPSFAEIYGTLSDAIHRAAEDPPLFEEQLDRISRHFEAKSVFDKNSAKAG